MQGKKIETSLYLQQIENIFAFNPQLFCQKIDKKLPTGKMNC